MSLGAAISEPEALLRVEVDASLGETGRHEHERGGGVRAEISSLALGALSSWPVEIMAYGVPGLLQSWLEMLLARCVVGHWGSWREVVLACRVPGAWR